MYVGMCDMPYMDSESEHRRVWTQNQNIANGFFFGFFLVLNTCIYMYKHGLHAGMYVCPNVETCSDQQDRMCIHTKNICVHAHVQRNIVLYMIEECILTKLAQKMEWVQSMACTPEWYLCASERGAQAKLW